MGLRRAELDGLHALDAVERGDQYRRGGRGLEAGGIGPFEGESLARGDDREQAAGVQVLGEDGVKGRRGGGRWRWRRRAGPTKGGVTAALGGGPSVPRWPTAARQRRYLETDVGLRRNSSTMRLKGSGKASWKLSSMTAWPSRAATPPA